ncbi:MAG: biotin transporter BioY [Brotaphodocola sp.]
MNCSTSTTKNASACRRFSTQDIVLAGMFAAVLAVISQISIPMPSGVPLTIQVFGIALVGSVLGWKLGVCSVLTYILLGAVGLPIFSNFRGGFGVLTGVTGGYIWSWPIMSMLCGIRLKTDNRLLNLFGRIIFAVIGLLIVETVGGLQWSFLAESMPLEAVFLYSITAFVPKDILLTILAVLLGSRIQKILPSSDHLA